MKTKKSVHVFHFSDFSVAEMTKNLNKAKKLGATHYDIVVNSTAFNRVGHNYIDFYKTLTKDEIIQEEVSALHKKIELLQSQ